MGGGAIALELRDRVMGSGPAQQTMLSEGSEPVKSALSTIRTKFIKNAPLSNAVCVHTYTV